MISSILFSRATFLSAALAALGGDVLLCPNVRSDVPQTSLPSSMNDKERDAQLQLASCLVRKSTSDYLHDDPTLAGPFLRLAFHDAATREDSSSTSFAAFSGGPNGSIKYELDWSENRGLSRPLKVIEQIHAEIVRNLNISLADTIALAGAQAVQAARGPTISIRLGRRDATKADKRNRRNNLQSDTTRSLVDTTLPSAGLDSEGLRLYFGALGLSDKEFVALCGAHDLGRHVTLLDMPKACLKNLTRECLENAPMLMPFVAEEPDTFSNSYFLKLLKWNDRRVALGEVAFIPTDVDLVVDEGLRRYVKHFARDKAAFYSTFATAYRKLVEPGTTSVRRY